SLMFPSATGALAYLGILTFGTTRILMIVSTLFIIFTLVLLYLNNSTQPSTFLIKIIGITLGTVVIIFSLIGNVVIGWEKDNFDDRRFTEVKEAKKIIGLAMKEKISISNLIKNSNISMPEKIRYISSRPVMDGLYSRNHSIVFNRTKNVSAKNITKSDDIKRDFKLKDLIRKIKRKKVKDKNGKMRKFTVEEAKKIALKKINSGIVPTMKRSGRVWDYRDIKTFYSTYNFKYGSTIYEVGYDYTEFRMKLHGLSYKLLLILIVLNILLIGVFPLLFRNILTKRLGKLLDGVKEVNDGNFKIQLDEKIMDEIGFLASSFNNMVSSISDAQNELKYYAENLEHMVSERTDELQSAMEELEAINENLLDAKKTAERDMNMAVYVQKSILPKSVPQVDEWDISYVFQAMSGISGDLFDFYTDNGHLIGLSISDVSGHGIASGLITMIARSVYFRNFQHNEKENLNTVLDKINADMIQEIGKVDNYITSIILRFKDDVVEYVNAGHTDLLYKNGEKKKVSIVNVADRDIKGLFLGFSEMQEPHDMMKFRVKKNDQLLLYTDCITESFNMDNEQYGEERLMSAFEKSPSGTAKEILDYILDDFNNFIGQRKVNDDLTAMVIKRKV
ncbi:SpoIIE family protein phosphatase, partial [Spirochaetota bacterium]